VVGVTDFAGGIYAAHPSVPDSAEQRRTLCAAGSFAGSQ